MALPHDPWREGAEDHGMGRGGSGPRRAANEDTPAHGHVLRATFATNLLARGIPISVVSELLGHSNIAVTSRYLAITKQARREAVERL